MKRQRSIRIVMAATVLMLMAAALSGQPYSSLLLPVNRFETLTIPSTTVFSTGTGYYDIYHREMINGGTESLASYRLSFDLSFPIRQTTGVTIRYFREDHALDYRTVLQHSLRISQSGQGGSLCFLQQLPGQNYLFSELRLLPGTDEVNWKFGGRYQRGKSVAEIAYNRTHVPLTGEFSTPDDTIGLDIKSKRDIYSLGLLIPISRMRVELHAKRSSVLSSDAPAFESLSVITAPHSARYSAELAYVMSGKASIFLRYNFNTDTSDVLMYWQNDDLGKIYTLDDSLTTVSLGLKYDNHFLELSKCHLSGYLNLSTSTRPFEESGLNLFGGTRFYTKAFIDLDYFSLRYSGSYHIRQMDVKLTSNFLHFKGDMDERDWLSLIFPIPETFHVTAIEINRLIINETELEVKTSLSELFGIGVKGGFLIPIHVDIDSNKSPSGDYETKSLRGGLHISITMWRSL